jgi:hypothetical protein
MTIYRTVPWNYPELDLIERRLHELYVSANPNHSEVRELQLRRRLLRGRVGKPDVRDPRNWTVFVMGIALMILLIAIGLCACAPQTEVINYRTYTDPDKGIFYIYDGVLDHAELITGVGVDQTRVIITRQGN